MSFELTSLASMHALAGYSHLTKITPGTVVFIAGQVALDVAGNLVQRINGARIDRG